MAELSDYERECWATLAAQMRCLYDALIELDFSDGDAMQIVTARAVPVPDLGAALASLRQEQTSPGATS
jgi:hypothetical protein